MYSAAALDDPDRLRAHDPGGMLGIVESTPALWRDAFDAAASESLPDWRGARGVVVCGMGGSGISGDVLAATAATRAEVPVVVVKGFDLPRWATSDALVVCVSYSGDTDEAVLCFDEAVERGCALVAVAGGGKLAARAGEAGVPCVKPAPPGLMPRAAFPVLAACVLEIGSRAGLVPDLEDEREGLLAATKDGVARWASGIPAERNEAKRIAAGVAGSRPQVWGQEGMLAVAAMRWKTQLNENAKINASWAVLPEALHNEIVPLSDAESFVVLRAAVERDGIAAAADALAEYGPVEAHALGDSDLAVLASSVLLGDLVSVYAAALREVDPTPIEPITRFKRSLG